MSRQYPIWIDINSCIYKSDKSYGIRSDGHQRIYVGTSSRNSHPFANVNIQRHETDEGTEFSYFVFATSGESQRVPDEELLMHISRTETLILTKASKSDKYTKIRNLLRGKMEFGTILEIMGEEYAKKD